MEIVHQNGHRWHGKRMHANALFHKTIDNRAIGGHKLFYYLVASTVLDLIYNLSSSLVKTVKNLQWRENNLNRVTGSS